MVRDSCLVKTAIAQWKIALEREALAIPMSWQGPLAF